MSKYFIEGYTVLEKGMVHMPLISALEMQKQVELCKSEAGLVYRRKTSTRGRWKVVGWTSLLGSPGPCRLRGEQELLGWRLGLRCSVSVCMCLWLWFLFYTRAFMYLCLETPFPPDMGISFSKRLSVPRAV